jgi:EAL domain-containing protein (putative c-di-GMP-specific phosphodiesterase class I)
MGTTGGSTGPGGTQARTAGPLGDGRAVAGSARILVIDDEDVNTLLLAAMLESAGFTDVERCTDANAALERFCDFAPDLVILDLHMPGIDGDELLRQVNEALPEDGFVPVMVITADVTAQARDRAFEAGATDFLTKPFDLHDCVLRVRNLLHIRHLNVTQATKNASLAERIRLRDELDARRTEQHLGIHRRLDAMLDRGGPTIVFQPIVSIAAGELEGYEALSRFDDPEGLPPDIWFADAASVGRGVELELHAIGRALGSLDEIPPGTFLSVNASPATMVTSELARVVADHDASRIVIELTEHEQVADYDALLAAISTLRGLGARIAVDDAGTGFAGLQQILQLGPDIIKLDRFLIEGVDHDAVRQSLATAMVAFSIAIGAQLLGEGIETIGELDTLRSLGVPLGQGYLLGRPAAIERSPEGIGELLAVVPSP